MSIINEYTDKEKVIIYKYDNVRINYGVKNNNIDVTDICKNNCVRNNIIFIPKCDHERAKIFGDPLPYVLKSIFVEYNKIVKNRLLNKSIGISLGLLCSSAVWGVENGYRDMKEQNYMTCPFDLMVSTHIGIIECIKDDFRYFTDIHYLELVKQGEEQLIIHKKYGFLFNHESPGHADLHVIEKWQFGKTHFIDNNYALFIERYNQRIENFRNYIHSGCFIHFITTIKDTTELKKTIDIAYPSLKFSILVIEK